MSFFTKQRTSAFPPRTPPREHHRPKRNRKDACRSLVSACLAILVFVGLGWALVATDTNNEAQALANSTCPEGQVAGLEPNSPDDDQVHCIATTPTATPLAPATTTPPSTTSTTQAPSDPDPPFEPADIQTAYAKRTATQPTGACDIAGQNSQYTTYYAELATNWCSLVKVYNATTGDDLLRLDINIVGKNQSGILPRTQLITGIATGALTMQIQSGTSTITCTAPAGNWSVAYFSSPRQIYLGRVFRCQTQITTTTSITINTITVTRPSASTANAPAS